MLHSGSAACEGQTSVIFIFYAAFLLSL